MLSFGLLDRLVERRVEQLDELAVFDERPRNPDVLAEAARDPLGDRRLAVARRAVQEQARARVDRRAQQVEHLRLDADAAERGRQLLAPRGFGPNRLRLDRHDVVVERHRHRARRTQHACIAARAAATPCSVSA